MLCNLSCFPIFYCFFSQKNNPRFPFEEKEKWYFFTLKTDNFGHNLHFLGGKRQRRLLRGVEMLGRFFLSLLCPFSSSSFLGVASSSSSSRHKEKKSNCRVCERWERRRAKKKMMMRKQDKTMSIFYCQKLSHCKTSHEATKAAYQHWRKK